MDMVTLFAPSLAFFALLFVGGMVGNTIVLVVYYRKFKPSATRSYILAMSVFDLLTNVLSLTLELTFHARYEHDLDLLCHVYGGLNSFLILCSGFVLVAVAVDRYRKICQPVFCQPAAGSARQAIVLCMLAALPGAGLTSVVSGSQNVNYTDRGFNVSGWSCFVAQQYQNSSLLHAYEAVCGGSFVFCVLLMLVSYGLIARRLLQHRRRRKAGLKVKPRGSHSSDQALPNAQTSDAVSFPDLLKSFGSNQSRNAGLDDVSSGVASSDPDEVRDSRGQAKTDQYDDSLCLRTTCAAQSQTYTIAETSETSGIVDGAEGGSEPGRNGLRWGISSASSGSIAAAHRCKINNPPRSRAKRIPRRTTVMMFVLTAAFVLNFLPYLVTLNIYKGKNDIDAGYWGLNLYLIARKSYFINSAINALVYGFCSASFRQHCRRLFSCRSSEYSL